MKKLFRLFFIFKVILRYRVFELITYIPKSQRLWFFSFLLIFLRSLTWFLPSTLKPLPDRLQLACEELGPVFIKFGQMLSMRPDLVGDEAAQSLSNLQDKLSPCQPELMMQRIHDALGDAYVDFEYIEPIPLAVASIAQVHAAKLLTGEDVVIKAQRLGIRSLIELDLFILSGLAGLLEYFHSDAKRLRLKRVVADYKLSILDELDFIKEAANTAKLAQNFAHSDDLWVMDVVSKYTTPIMMVMRRIPQEAISIRDIGRLKEAGVNLQVLASKGVRIFFTQVFKHNFFHADMHSGNIFVDISSLDNPRYIAIDCAIMGTLTHDDQMYLANNFMAFFNQDYRRVVQLHLESQWIPPDTDLKEFEALIRSLCEPLFRKPMGEIEFGVFLFSLFSAARKFDVYIQPQLVLLQKTLLYIEGLGRQLYPQLNLWDTAKPFLAQWLGGKEDCVQDIKNNIALLPDILSLAVKMPSEIFEFRMKIEQIQQGSVQQSRLLKRLEATLRLQYLLIASTSFLLLVSIGGFVWHIMQ